MGDVCTGSPTLTSFSTSTALSTVVTQSTSQSISVGEASVVTRTVTSGTSVIVEESTIPGVTATVQVEVPVTLTNEQVITVPVATLFAPCSATTTSTPTSRSSSTSSDAPETTPTPNPGTSSTRSRSTANQASETNNNQASNTQNNAATTPAATNPASQTPQTETGTLITSFSTGIATLSDGSQSSFVTSFTTSIPPNGTLNGNGSNGGGSGSNSKAVAIGVGVTGGVIALIILMFGITWHIRRRRRNSFEGMDDGDIWNPGNEPKNPLSPRHNVRAGSGYTYNPYADAPVRYAPVPTGSPPVSRPLSLADPNAGNGYPPPYPPSALPSNLGVTAPLLGRVKTADEILYEAARQDLPRSRTSSAAASHQTRASETGLIHRPNASVSASHRTHTSVSASHMTHASESMKSRRSESVGGMLADHQDVHARYQGAIEAPLEPERSMSPVSVVAPRLAIANPDTDRD